MRVRSTVPAPPVLTIVPASSQNRASGADSSQAIPVLGVGTWGMAERPRHRADEITALRRAVDLGMTVIDTAEMYAGGAAEEPVAEALGDRRREIFLVSKVLPQHATRRGTVSACEASLRRLNTDHLDLYLLHWRGTVPLDETLAAFDALERQGKTRHWGSATSTSTTWRPSSG